MGGWKRPAKVKRVVRYGVKNSCLRKPLYSLPSPRNFRSVSSGIWSFYPSFFYRFARLWTSVFPLWSWRMIEARNSTSKQRKKISEFILIELSRPFLFHFNFFASLLTLFSYMSNLNPFLDSVDHDTAAFLLLPILIAPKKLLRQFPVPFNCFLIKLDWPHPDPRS